MHIYVCAKYDLPKMYMVLTFDRSVMVLALVLKGKKNSLFILICWSWSSL